jgi:hypothetical protein
MRFIEKHSKAVAVLLSVSVACPMLYGVSATENDPGWKGTGSSRYYIEQGSSKRATGLMEIDDNLYYFSGTGELQSGWQIVSNDTYYFDEDGVAVTGEQTIQGVDYNFQSDGTLKHGWSDDGTQYYDEKGFLVKNQWVQDDGNYYYFDDNGIRLTGWQELDGKTYYFLETGEKATEKAKIDDTTYYFSTDGEYVTGYEEQEDGTTLYRSTTNGKVLKNAAEEVDGVLRYFDEDGQMAKDIETEDYTVDKNGVATAIDKEKLAKEEAEKKAQEEQEAQEAAEAAQKAYEEQLAAQKAATSTSDGTTSDSSYQAIANAALAQVGVNQDCTMLATNALAAVGISYHNWPENYAVLGSWTSNPVPGDLCIYSGHIAVYIGNGQAVHGGWNGYTTVVYSVACTNTFLGYIHVNLG